MLKTKGYHENQITTIFLRDKSLENAKMINKKTSPLPSTYVCRTTVFDELWQLYLGKLVLSVTKRYKNEGENTRETSYKTSIYNEQLYNNTQQKGIF